MQNRCILAYVFIIYHRVFREWTSSWCWVFSQQDYDWQSHINMLLLFFPFWKTVVLCILFTKSKCKLTLKAFPVGLFCQFSRKRSLADWPEFKPHDTNTWLQHPHWYLISSHMILSLRYAIATIILADMPDRIVLVGSKSIQYHSSSYSVSFALQPVMLIPQSIYLQYVAKLLLLPFGWFHSFPPISKCPC